MNGNDGNSRRAPKKFGRQCLALFLSLLMVLTCGVSDIGTVLTHAADGKQSVSLGVSSVHFSSGYLTSEEAEALKTENPDAAVSQVDIAEVLDGSVQGPRHCTLTGKRL